MLKLLLQLLLMVAWWKAQVKEEKEAQSNDEYEAHANISQIELNALEKLK